LIFKSYLNAYYHDDVEFLEKILSDQALAIASGEIKQRAVKVFNI
jgi:hypothetical protein